MSTMLPEDGHWEKAVACEKTIAPLRLLIVLFGVLVYPFLGPTAGDASREAWLVLAVCALYSGALVIFQPLLRGRGMGWACGISILDGVLTLWWVQSTGGLYSPFYGTLYACMISICLRHDFLGSLLGAVGMTAGYVLVIEQSHQLFGEEYETIVRIAYVFVVGLAGALFSKQLLAQDRRLRETNCRLQSEIAEREKAEARLRKLVVELERSNQALENFAYVASHDLREPLRMVTSYCVLLEKRFKDQLGPDGTAFLHFALDGAKRMKKLIDAVLALSQVQRLPWSPLPVPLDRPLRTALDNLRAAIDEKQAQITFTPLPTVSGHEPLLALVLQNLIGNAIKFNHSQPPLIHVAAAPSSQGWLISVHDNGIGIPSEFQARLFVLFRRLHARHEFEGTGLGLAICKEIVEKHRGRIWIESTAGRGATFFFTLESAETAANPSPRIDWIPASPPSAEIMLKTPQLPS